MWVDSIFSFPGEAGGPAWRGKGLYNLGEILHVSPYHTGSFGPFFVTGVPTPMLMPAAAFGRRGFFISKKREVDGLTGQLFKTPFFFPMGLFSGIFFLFGGG